MYVCIQRHKTKGQLKIVAIIEFNLRIKSNMVVIRDLTTLKSEVTTDVLGPSYLNLPLPCLRLNSDGHYEGSDKVFQRIH